jgi:uncharacterized protein (DUF1697 family)
MIYVALLRGINVGGKNKIDMKKLKKSFENIGMLKVITYINSGNVIFEDTEHNKDEILSLLEEVIYKDFLLNIKVLIRSLDDFELIIKNLPYNWNNDKDMKCDVLFLWDEIDSEKLVGEIEVKPNIDTIIYVPGAILWAVNKINLTKSGLMKMAGTILYKKMTIRNVNTTRKIYELMKGMQK